MKSSYKAPNVLIKCRLKAWLSIKILALPHEKVELFKAEVAKAVLQMLSTARISSFSFKTMQVNGHNKGVLRLYISNDVAH